MHLFSFILVATLATFLPFSSTATIQAPSATSSHPVTVGYYADWTSSRLSPTSIPFSKLTHLNYAFAINDANGTFTLPTAPLLTQIVSLAKPHNTKVLLSVGGWTGSRYFSTLMATPEKRSYLITQFINFIHTFKLDGIDIDWEYPGRVGMSCNVVDPSSDSDNFLLFLREYKAACTSANVSNTELTMAVRITPFDKNGVPMNDLSAFAALTDRINIMAYDLNGSWSPGTGSNAPMYAASVAESVVGAVDAWNRAQWPLEKMTVGVPMYGRAVTTKDTVATTNVLGATIVSTSPKGDGDDAPWAEPCPGAPSVFSGIWKYTKLRQGPLQDDAWAKGFDEMSKTPWLYHATSRTFVSYEDAKSATYKTTWAVCSKKVAGVMVWDLSQDHENELLTAINKAIAC